MPYIIPTNNVPVMLECEIYAPVNRAIKMGVRDYDTKTIIFTRRVNTFVGHKKFQFMLPLSPKNAEIVIVDANNGKEGVAKLVNCVKMHLPTRITSFDNTNPQIADFIKFAFDFCRKAGYLLEGRYASDSKNVKIDYMRYLLVEKNGSAMKSNSPARIDSESKIIQVSIEHFKNYTVAGRFAILSHEFSHCFLNKNMKDEMEADYNCAMIYLGLGFPRVDLLTTWCNVYKGADNEMNRQRYKKFLNYVDNFDNYVAKPI